MAEIVGELDGRAMIVFWLTENDHTEFYIKYIVRTDTFLYS